MKAHSFWDGGGVMDYASDAIASEGWRLKHLWNKNVLFYCGLKQNNHRADFLMADLLQKTGFGSFNGAHVH